MVLGSIGYGGIDNIRRVYSLLREDEFSILNHVEEEHMDYSSMDDFRDQKELSKKIVEHDLKYVQKADVLVVLTGTPSYGTAIEMYVARNLGKKVILLAENPIPTPWPIYFSDYVVKTEEELLNILRRLGKEGVIQHS
jgi:nucleoside 2-deoxyribosyltransferase